MVSGCKISQLKVEFMADTTTAVSGIAALDVLE
jgi:hypothetical protein